MNKKCPRMNFVLLLFDTCEEITIAIPVTFQSFSHLVTQSLGHSVTRSLGHLIT